jgi:hypothetical protein
VGATTAARSVGSWNYELFVWMPHLSHTNILLLPISLYLIMLIFSEEKELWSSSLCDFPRHPVISSILGPNPFSSASCSQEISYVFVVGCKNQVSHPYKPGYLKVWVLYLLMLCLQVEGGKTNEFHAAEHSVHIICKHFFFTNDALVTRLWRYKH